MSKLGYGQWSNAYLLLKLVLMRGEKSLRTLRKIIFSLL